jgi:hypothetical protein
MTGKDFYEELNQYPFTSGMLEAILAKDPSSTVKVMVI